MKIKTELLSPAKNVEFGIEAIKHGADAVYIGAPKFGARAAAGNSIFDIEKLCRYAHLYQAKVFVALNTILSDEELEEALSLVYRLYETGVDALIIQDMGFLMLDLPPIPLHASTQTDNRTPEKVAFLESAGFERAILARELSLREIKTIRQQTTIGLEVFVHGALCVSLSGQCYMSQYACGRSANRGECAQLCRLPYTLQDAKGNVLVRDKYLLSLKDMNRSASLGELLEAGVTSFKIEGRLKDLSYVKNVTAYYRQALDALLEGKKEFCRSSSGETRFFFVPDPEKTFNRGKTGYFIVNEQEKMSQWNTPKSLGEYAGCVKEVKDCYFTVQSDTQFANGDGLCFFNDNEKLEGFRINKVDKEKLFPVCMPPFSPKTHLYRNYNQAFEKQMQGKTAERKIAITVLMNETKQGFQIQLQDMDGNKVLLDETYEKIPAQKAEQALNTIKKQWSKLGNTIFELKNIEIVFSQPRFIASSHLADWRRKGVEALVQERLLNAKKKRNQATPLFDKKNVKTYYQEKVLSYRYNVMNSKAEEFYLMTGASAVLPAMEKELPEKPVLMFCKYCIKRELGFCRNKNITSFEEPFYLNHANRCYKLEFDCSDCMMKIIAL